MFAMTGVASRSRLPVFHDENRPPTPSHAASSSASCSSSSSSSGAAAPPQQLQSFFKQRVSIHAPHGSSLWPASQSLKASAPSRKAARIALSDLPNASSNALLPHPIDAAGKRADVRQRAEAILRDARAAAAPSGPGTARIAGTGAALPTSRSFTGGTGRGGVGGVALLSSASFSVHSDTGCGADQGGVKRKAEEDDDDGDEFGEGGAEDDCDDVAIHADPDAKDVDMNRARTQAPRPPPSISVDSFLSSSSSSSSSSSPVHAHMMSISPSSAASSVGPSAVSLALSAFCHSNASRPVEAHLVISDYQPSILRHLLQSQHAHAPSPCYLSALQPDLNARMREILIDWMHDVSGKFRLQQETLFLAIHVMDRFLSRVAVTRRRLQLVGCVALLLACKYEEMLVPEVEDFVHISDRSYTKAEMITMEAAMLNALRFELTSPSPLRFVECMDSQERLRQSAGDAAAQRAAVGADGVKELSVFLLHITLQHYHFLCFRPALMALSAWLLAVRTLRGAEAARAWTVRGLEAFLCEEAELRICMEQVWEVWHRISLPEGEEGERGVQSSQYRAVQRKFSRDRYGQVVKVVVRRP